MNDDASPMSMPFSSLYVSSRPREAAVLSPFQIKSPYIDEQSSQLKVQFPNVPCLFNVCLPLTFCSTAYEAKSTKWPSKIFLFLLTFSLQQNHIRKCHCSTSHTLWCKSMRLLRKCTWIIKIENKYSALYFFFFTSVPCLDSRLFLK